MFRRDFALCVLIFFAPLATVFGQQTTVSEPVVHRPPPFTAAGPSTKTKVVVNQPSGTDSVPSALGTTVQTPVVEKIKWQKDLDIGRSTMVKTKRPMLLYLTAPSCQYCELMKLDTFAQQWIVRELNKKYTPVMINGREHKVIADKLNVRMFPTTAIVHPNGKVMDVVQGYKSPADFIKYMAVASAKLKIESAQVAKREQQKKETSVR